MAAVLLGDQFSGHSNGRSQTVLDIMKGNRQQGGAVMRRDRLKEPEWMVLSLAVRCSF